MDDCPKLLFCFCLLLNITVSSTIDTINTTQVVRDGEFIVSANGTFEMGFFSPNGSKNRYLGIRYGKIPVRTVVWIANRKTPLNDSSGVFRITNQGILVILNQNGSMIWSSNSSRSAKNPVAQLLDSGNLIVKDEGGDHNDPTNLLWQSFDHPGDTVLPGMKVGWNIKVGIEWFMSSWKAIDDPSPGQFTVRLDLGGYPEYFLRKGSAKQFRLGPWNGLMCSGLVQRTSINGLTEDEFVYNEEEIYWRFRDLNNSLHSRVVLSYEGNVLAYEWIERTQDWMAFRMLQNEDCDNYALCGMNSICNINNGPLCGCLRGFVPKTAKERNKIGWSDGCVRKTPLNCFGDGFLKYSGMKLPETRKSWYNESMNLQECEDTCKKNCSCLAYANLDIRQGRSSCLHWFHDLLDIRQFNGYGQDIYIRMAASELDLVHGGKINAQPNHVNVKMRSRIVLASVLATVMLLLGLALLLYIRKRKQHKGKMAGIFEKSSNKGCQKEDFELPLFDLGTIASATNNFSDTSKIGQGGFGPVFKGKLKDGQEIAVKRLSRSSNQGLQEFKNEVMYIVKLQHRNLVKLLGCCIQADEKMLIYEFMPNKSLDSFIFDQILGIKLNWPTRYHIIDGIARGLLYLHQDSRLKIIHRDLKASNVLLDYHMNPKISDFGLARSFGVNETHAQTNKVVGTNGYMSPEYAVDGQYSVKSDVFSFGVIVLEIVSGKKNRGFRHPEHNLNLLGHAWKLHKERRSSELIAESLTDSCNISEVLRSVHIALLCVQRSPEDRPSMSSVIVMLGGEGALPQPKQPGFFNERDIIEDGCSSSSSNHKRCSLNSLTITELEAR